MVDTKTDVEREQDAYEEEYEEYAETADSGISWATGY
jgi:hypothetical protein